MCSSDLEEEARRIAAEGALDTWVRCVPAFSSLGWFSDPLYSSMINGRDHQIAELVVHESLHATVWVKGGVDFNEKLANFAGLEGSVRYMENEKGVAGVQLVREEVRGEKIFADFMKGALDLYRSSVKNQDDKAKFYGSLSGSYASFLEQKRKSGEKFTAVRAKLDGWNNAALLAYANYYSDFSVLEKMLAACKGDLGRFVAWISKVQREAGDEFSRAPEDYLGRLSLCP